MKEIEYLEKIENLEKEIKNLTDEKITLEYRIKGYERELKLVQNAKEGYKNMLSQANLINIEMQGKIDNALKELNQPWGLANYEDGQKDYEHKRKVISILKSEEVQNEL